MPKIRGQSWVIFKVVIFVFPSIAVAVAIYQCITNQIRYSYSRQKYLSIHILYSYIRALILVKYEW